MCGVCYITSTSNEKYAKLKLNKSTPLVVTLKQHMMEKNKHVKSGNITCKKGQTPNTSPNNSLQT